MPLQLKRQKPPSRSHHTPVRMEHPPFCTQGACGTEMLVIYPCHVMAELEHGLAPWPAILCSARRVFLCVCSSCLTSACSGHWILAVAIIFRHAESLQWAAKDDGNRVRVGLAWPSHIVGGKVDSNTFGRKPDKAQIFVILQFILVEIILGVVFGWVLHRTSSAIISRGFMSLFLLLRW